MYKYLNPSIVAEEISELFWQFAEIRRLVMFADFLHPGLLQDRTFEQGETVDILLDEVVILSGLGRLHVRVAHLSAIESNQFQLFLQTRHRTNSFVIVFTANVIITFNNKNKETQKD